MNTLKELDAFVRENLSGFEQGNDVVIDAVLLDRLIHHVKIVAHAVGINEGFAKAEAAFNEAIKTIERNK